MSSFQDDLYTIALSGILFIILAGGYYLYQWWQTRQRLRRAQSFRTQSFARPASVGDEDEDESKPLARILFGTQTGTAEMFSRTLAKEGKSYGFRTRAEDLLDYEKDEFERETLVIFVIATYGEGEPTDSSKDFYEWFNEQEKDQLDLSEMKFAVFGLGDSQYKHFNAMGKDTEKKLQELGATMCFRRGEGDADKALEEDFEEWKADLWPALATEFGTTYDEAETDKFTIERTTKLKFEPTAKLMDNWQPFPAFSTRFIDPSAKNPVFATVEENKELLNAAARSTLHISFDIKGTGLKYESGDHLAIYPANPPALVDRYLEVIETNGDFDPETTPLALVGLRGGSATQLPMKCTLRQALTWYLDLSSAPKKEVLKAFSQSATDPNEKEEFMVLLKNNDDAKKEYKKLVEKLRDTRGWMQKFKSVRVPADLFLEIMPRLQPRYYSIASDSLQQPDSIHVCVAVMEGGICTPFLAAQEVGARVPMYVRRSTFHLPSKPTNPILLVGPGTGIAPMVGFLWRRRALKAQGEELGKCSFFFGCRYEKEDFIYRGLLEECQAEGVITDLHVAFSREQATKRYVQHDMAERPEEVWAVISQQEGTIYVCGDAKHMARDVEATLLQVIQSQSEDMKTAVQAEEYIEKLAGSDRYLKDVWSVHS